MKISKEEIRKNIKLKEKGYLSYEDLLHFFNKKMYNNWIKSFQDLLDWAREQDEIISDKKTGMIKFKSKFKNYLK